MKYLGIYIIVLFGLLLLLGCASSDVTTRRSNVGEERIARPNRIIVHNFAATPDDVPADSAIADLYARRDTPQTETERGYCPAESLHRKASMLLALHERETRPAGTGAALP